MTSAAYESVLQEIKNKRFSYERARDYELSKVVDRDTLSGKIDENGYEPDIDQFMTFSKFAISKRPLQRRRNYDPAKLQTWTGDTYKNARDARKVDNRESENCLKILYMTIPIVMLCFTWLSVEMNLYNP